MNTTPVSYTHLDVYKRQRSDDVVGQSRDDRQIFSTSRSRSQQNLGKTIILCEGWYDDVKKKEIKVKSNIKEENISMKRNIVFLKRELHVCRYGA